MTLGVGMFFSVRAVLVEGSLICARVAFTNDVLNPRRDSLTSGEIHLFTSLIVRKEDGFHCHNRVVNRKPQPRLS